MSKYKLVYDYHDNTVALLNEHKASVWNYIDDMLNRLTRNILDGDFWDNFTPAEFLEIWGDAITSERVEVIEFDTKEEVIDYLENLDLILELKK